MHQTHKILTSLSPSLPSSLPSPSDTSLQAHKDDYLYLAQVSFIKELKASVPFAESSPMLNDISALPSWMKVGPPSLPPLLLLGKKEVSVCMPSLPPSLPPSLASSLFN